MASMTFKCAPDEKEECKIRFTTILRIAVIFETFRRVENELVHDLEIPIEFKGRRVIDIPQEKLRLVKKFQRSAAGQKMDAKDDIRSPKVCFQTTLYLMHL